MKFPLLEVDHTNKEYKEALIRYLLSGQTTPDEWEEVASAVLHASEMCKPNTRHIDGALYGSCFHCSEPLYAGCCDCCAREEPNR